MRLPRSTDLPQRATLSPCTSLLFILACIALFTQYAFAAKDDSIAHVDHSQTPLNGALEVDVGHDLERYEPDFAGADRSIIGRAGDATPALGNNVPGILNLSQNTSQYWVFPNKTLFGPKSPQTPGLPSYFEGQDFSVTPDDSGEVELYISLTTCRQPLAKDSNSNGAPDQLKLYVSTSSSNQRPDENGHDYAVSIEGGFGWLKIFVKNDIYFGVYAPASEGFDGAYNYQLTASIDGFYASSYSDPNVHFIDSDSNSALLYTNNIINITNSSDPVFKQWMDRSPPFSLFLQNQEGPSGLQNSVCGLKNVAQIQDPSDVETVMTAAGNGLPKQQFHAKNLNRSSTYYAVIAILGNSTDQGPGVVGGGGTVWANGPIVATKTCESFNVHVFITESNRGCLVDNCALLYNLSFCTSVAYAAPANPGRFNTTALLAQYDQYAQNLYQNFMYSLQQIPCNTTSSAQYSLARNCNDCDAAYRHWLCAVTIPRCEDFSKMAPYLQPRAVNQPFINQSYAVMTDGDSAFDPKNRKKAAFTSSRNPMIDAAIQPGPYKELLPCKDLCYNLTRSCPAALKFACPLEGYGLDYSYGSPRNSTSGEVTCNSPWTGMNGAAGLRVTAGLAFAVALIAAFMTTAL